MDTATGTSGCAAGSDVLQDESDALATRCSRCARPDEELAEAVHARAYNVALSFSSFVELQLHGLLHLIAFVTRRVGFSEILIAASYRPSVPLAARRNVVERPYAASVVEVPRLSAVGATVVAVAPRNHDAEFRAGAGGISKIEGLARDARAELVEGPGFGLCHLLRCPAAGDARSPSVRIQRHRTRKQRTMRRHHRCGSPYAATVQDTRCLQNQALARAGSSSDYCF